MKKVFGIILVLLILLFNPGIINADDVYTVTFYTDGSLNTIFETQEVEWGNIPQKPTNNPPAYVDGSFKYEFSGWYRKIFGKSVLFAFEGEECEIYSNENIFAIYTAYLADDYYMIVTNSNGTEYIDDTETPISTLSQRYLGSQIIFEPKSNYVSSTEGNECAIAIVSGQEIKYNSLNDAINSADNNSTLSLLKDTEINSSTSINKDITFNLNSFKLSGSALTINGNVIIEGLANSALSNDINVNGSLIIKSGDYTGMVLNNNEGSVVIEGGTFSFNPSNYVDNTLYDVNKIDDLYHVVNHSHNYDYSNPSWSWVVQDSETKAIATYTCACGTTVEEIFTPSYVDSKGTRTYTAIDSHNNSTTKEEVLAYTVSLNDVIQDTTYHWGDVCVLTLDECSTWYFGSIMSKNKVADGVKTHTFAVTENTELITEKSEYNYQQAAVRTTFVSGGVGKATFNAKWSLPSGAKNINVAIYRGYTTTDKDVSADTIMTKSTPYDVNLNVRNGDFTFYISDMTASYYQHIIIAIDYSINDVQKQLISSVQKLQIE